MSTSYPDQLILYVYFSSTDILRDKFKASVRNSNFEELNEKYGALGRFIFFHHSESGILMKQYYSSMYVVAEGWQEIGLENQEIDELLSSENLRLLKRFRNGTFHFQKSFPTEKWTDFIYSVNETADWIDDLYQSFSKYFWAEENWKSLGLDFQTPLKEQLKETGGDLVQDMKTMFTILTKDIIE